MKKLLFFLLCIWVVLPLGAQSIFINSEISKNPDDIWHQGSDELLSVYLQVNGLKTVSRNKLSQLIEEIELNESGFTAKQISKGKWLGAEYLVIGNLHKSQDLYTLKISVTKSSTGLLLKSWTKELKDKDKIALAIKELAPLIKREIGFDSKKEIISSAKKNTSSPFSQNPITLLKFFEAVNLMQTGKEAEGMVELIQLTVNAPKFEYPYIWIAGFFEKYGYKKISTGLRKSLTNETLKSLNQHNSKAVLIYSNQIKKDDISTLKKIFKKHNFSFIDPKSITAMDTEKQLQKWGFTEALHNIAQLADYQSSLLISLNKSALSTSIKISNSKDGRTLFEKNFQNLDTFYKEIETLLETYKKGGLTDIKQTNNLNEVLPPDNYKSKDIKTKLFFLLTQKGIPVSILYRIIDQLRYKSPHYNEFLWEELLSRVPEKEKELYYSTYFLLKDSLSSRTYGSYNVREATEFIKNVDELKSENPLIVFTQTFNKAYLALHSKEYKQALNLFEKSFSLLEAADIEHETSQKYIEPSLYYWSWYCSLTLGAKDSENKYLKSVKMYMEKKPLPSLKVLLSPCLFIRKTDISIQDILNKKPDLGITEKLSAKSAYAWEYDLSVKIKIPQMPIRATKNTLEDAQKAVSLFIPWFEENYAIIPNNHQDKRVDNFIKAVSHLVSNPDFKVSAELKTKILSQTGKMRPYERVKLYCIFEEYDKVKRIILEDNSVSANSKKYCLNSIARNTLDPIQYMEHNIIAQRQSTDDSIVRFWNLIYCFDRLNTEKARKYLNVIKKKKNLSERNNASILFCEAEVLRLEGKALQALELFKKIQEKYWDKNYYFELGGKLNTKVRQKITYLSMETRKEFKKSKWFLTTRRGTDDHFHNGRKRTALTHLDKDICDDFIKIYKKLYYVHSLSDGKIDDDISGIATTYGSRLVPQLIKLLNSTPTFREGYIAERILKLLASPENAAPILKGFKSNYWLLPYALKANKGKALEILEENIWIFGGEGFITPVIVDAILNNNLSSAYPVLYSYLLESRSNFIPHLMDVKRRLHKDVSPKMKDSLLFILKKALSISKSRINEKYYSRQIFSVSELAFTCGILDGLITMIELTQLKEGHIGKALSGDIVHIFNKNTLGKKAKNINDITSFLKHLSWSREKKKWLHSEEIVNKNIKIPEISLENTSILDLSQFKLQISKVKETEFKIPDKGITLVEFERHTIGFSSVDNDFTWWYLDSSGSRHWSIDYIKGATELDDFDPDKYKILNLKRRNPKFNKNIYGVKSNEIVILKNDLDKYRLFLMQFEYLSDKIKVQYKIIETTKK